MVPSATVRDLFVEANGLRHHLLVRGHPGAPVLMMIHGLAGQAHTFDAVATRLSERFHVYCLDVRGRGETQWGPPDGYHVESYASDLEAVRKGLGLERFSLIGTSMGGLISTYYAPRHPEVVSKVVLNDIGPEVDPAGLARIMGYVTNAPEAFQDMKAVTRYYREHYAPLTAHLSDDQVADFARWHVRKSDSGLYVWKMDPAVRAAVPPTPSMTPWEAFKAIQCPVLILRGAQSDMLSAATAARMVAELPGTRLAEVPGVGHAPLLVEPAAVKALDEFLA